MRILVLFVLASTGIISIGIDKGVSQETLICQNVSVGDDLMEKRYFNSQGNMESIVYFSNTHATAVPTDSFVQARSSLQLYRFGLKQYARITKDPHLNNEIGQYWIRSQYFKRYHLQKNTLIYDEYHDFFRLRASVPNGMLDTTSSHVSDTLQIQIVAFNRTLLTNRFSLVMQGYFQKALLRNYTAILCAGRLVQEVYEFDIGTLTKLYSYDVDDRIHHLTCEVQYMDGRHFTEHTDYTYQLYERQRE